MIFNFRLGNHRRRADILLPIQYTRYTQYDIVTLHANNTTMRIRRIIPTIQVYIVQVYTRSCIGTFFLSIQFIYLLLFFCPFNRMIFMSRFRRRRNNLYKAVLCSGTYMQYRPTAIIILPSLQQVNNIIYIYIQARLYSAPCAYMRIVAHVSRSSSCNIFITFSVTIISYSCVVVK